MTNAELGLPENDVLTSIIIDFVSPIKERIKSQLEINLGLEIFRDKVFRRSRVDLSPMMFGDSLIRITLPAYLRKSVNGWQVDYILRIEKSINRNTHEDLNEYYDFFDFYDCNIANFEDEEFRFRMNSLFSGHLMILNNTGLNEDGIYKYILLLDTTPKISVIPEFNGLFDRLSNMGIILVDNDCKPMYI